MVKDAAERSNRFMAQYINGFHIGSAQSRDVGAVYKTLMACCQYVQKIKAIGGVVQRYLHSHFSLSSPSIPYMYIVLVYRLNSIRLPRNFGF